ncbi:hypothetical protein H0H92_000950 [Tricholoma furcatifolium]|nr:hypothetical protein H0H92_000950 [Tricholoma furcatifolium]
MSGSFYSAHQRGGPEPNYLYPELTNAHYGNVSTHHVGSLSHPRGSRLVATNFARLALECQRWFTGEDIVTHMLAPGTIDEVKSICDRSSDDLLVHDILQLPEFAASVVQRAAQRMTESSNTVTIRRWLQEMSCNPLATAAVFDNGFNFVSLFKVYVPGARYLLSSSSGAMAQILSDSIANKPTPGAHSRTPVYLTILHVRTFEDVSGIGPEITQGGLSAPDRDDTVFANELQLALQISELEYQSQQAGPSTSNAARNILGHRRGDQWALDRQAPASIHADEDTHRRGNQWALDRQAPASVHADEDTAFESARQMHLPEVRVVDRHPAPRASSSSGTVDDDAEMWHLINFFMPGYSDATVQSPVQAPQPSIDLDCGVCMDSFAENLVIRISGCQHVFCNDCMKGAVQADLEARRFPIQCPTCMAERSSSNPNSTIGDDIIDRLGLQGSDIRIFKRLKRAAARGPKKHLKRLAAPSSWMLDKLSGTYAPRPSPGPHKLRESLPLTIFLRNRLKYALNGREVTSIVKQRLIKIDNKVRTDETFPAGFMDVISIEKSGEHFRLLYDVKGRFTIHRITPEEASYKLLKVRRVALGARGVPHIVTHDGRTIRYPDPLIQVNDTVKYDLEQNKIVDFVKFDTGNIVMITGGRNMGRAGVIVHREKHVGGFDIVHVKDSLERTFATRVTNIFVIGEGTKPWISLPKGKGTKLTISEERDVRRKQKANEQ